MATPHLDDPAPPRIDLGGGWDLTLQGPGAKGSSATVYRAMLGSPSGLWRPVAVKLFSSLSSEDDQFISQLVRIGRRLAQVDHPNVAKVYECGVWRSQPFFVTELVEGVSLGAFQRAHAARQRRVPLDVALFVACEVAEGLAGARVARDHEGLMLGVVHHNLNANEVLLSWRGEVKVTDFGTSIARAATSSIRSLSGVAGRATSKAPEVAQGAEADARSDVFSFGVLLRELFIGPRFPAGLTNADALRLAREGYVHPLTFQPQLPAELMTVITRALEVDPEARYPNACALSAELRRVALAMGVGDGRWFLRSALQREWSEYVDDVTAEVAVDPSPRGHDAPSEDTIPNRDLFALEQGQVVPLNRRR